MSIHVFFSSIDIQILKCKATKNKKLERDNTEYSNGSVYPPPPLSQQWNNLGDVDINNSNPSNGFSEDDENSDHVAGNVTYTTVVQQPSNGPGVLRRSERIQNRRNGPQWKQQNNSNSDTSNYQHPANSSNQNNVWQMSPVHVFNILYYRYAVAMIFAVNEINRDPHLLPNHTLAYVLYDSCYTEVRALAITMRLLSGEKKAPNYHCGSELWPIAVLGDSPSTSSVIMARILGVYRYPQISYGSTLPFLSDKQQFPSFVRTISSFTVQVIAMTQLMKHFAWTWIGILAADNDLGLEGSQSLLLELAKRGSCVAFLEILPAYNSKSRLRQIAEKIKASSAKVIIVCSTQQYIIPLMEEVTMQNISNKIWIAPIIWINSLVFHIRENWKTLNGTLGFTMYNPEIPEFREYVYNIIPSTTSDDTFLTLFWETIFRCKWMTNQNTTISILDGLVKTPFCTGTESLKKLQTSVYESYSFQEAITTYNAVYILAHALHRLLSCDIKDVISKNESCGDVATLQPWQLLNFIRTVHFTNTAGQDVYFDKNGDMPNQFDIQNFQFFLNGTSRIVKVGIFTSWAPADQQIQIDKATILWNDGAREIPHAVCSESCRPGYRKSTRKGQPVCCFDCTPCSEGKISNQTDSNDCIICPDDEWPIYGQDKCIPKLVEFLSYKEELGASLATLSVFFTALTASVLCVFIKFRETPVIKANNRDLSYLLLLGLFLCFLCSLLFIGRPERVTCLIRQVAFGVIFTLSVSCIIAKTITVIVAFTATNPNSSMKKWVGPKTPSLLILLCSLGQIVICIAWLSAQPPFQNNNMKIKLGKIIIECQEGSSVAFACMLGYMGFLAILCFVIAFLARKLPDTFNETQMITTSMYIFLSVWTSFIPAYLSTQGKYMVAVEVFAILASSAGLLFSIFIPKCYVVLLRPEKNTRTHITGKANRHAV
ncbi:extracellular calcium-sensing receptor-like [Protopterus annectens]|uniref:extracellular calcium-sensing receptor-like n=1 Tax=Protopterus annectens TaxID=7888 RepID=UPI001CF9ABDE|nr:extracellular calcium-sensing receptor-like [Protopterus annectens]